MLNTTAGQINKPSSILGGETAGRETGIGPLEIPVLSLFQILQAAALAKSAHEMPQRRQALPMHVLRQRFQRYVRLEKAYENAYRCEICKKDFLDKGCMWIAFDLCILCYLGVRPYKCNLCEKSFTQRCSLESHCLKVHGVAHSYEYKQRRSKVREGTQCEILHF